MPACWWVLTDPTYCMKHKIYTSFAPPSLDFPPELVSSSWWWWASSCGFRHLLFPEVLTKQWIDLCQGFLFNQTETFKSSRRPFIRRKIKTPAFSSCSSRWMITSVTGTPINNVNRMEERKTPNIAATYVRECASGRCPLFVCVAIHIKNVSFFN